MMWRPPEYRPLLRIAGILLKYYLLAWFCFIVLCLFLAGLGAVHLVSFWLVMMAIFLVRLAIFLFCFVAIAAIAEAWHYW
jgi:hypothetical protein